MRPYTTTFIRLTITSIAALVNSSCGYFSNPEKQGSIVYYSTAEHFWGSKKPKKNRNDKEYIKEGQYTDAHVLAYSRALSDVLKERSRHNWAGQQVNKGFSDTVSLITGANNLLRLTNNQLGFVGLGGTVSTKVQNFLHPLDHPKVYYTAGRRISQEYDKYLLAQAECNLGVSEQSLTNNGRTLKHNVEVHFHNAYSQIHFDDTADPNKSDLKKYSNEKEKKG